MAILRGIHRQSAGFDRHPHTTAGLKVKAFFNEKIYVKGLKVTDAEMNALNLERSDVCPQWNYTIRPLGILA
jgi:hypothetical protein